MPFLCSAFILTSAIPDGRRCFFEELVLHAEVEVVSSLVFGQPEQADGGGHAPGLAVVDSGAPGRAAPGAPNMWSVGFQDL